MLRMGLMRTGPTSIVLLAATLSAPAARADGIERCQELYVEAAFDAARRCVAAELEGLAEQPDAIRDAYALLAATELAAERAPAARRAVQIALAIDPAFAPADPVLRAPRVLSLFREVGAAERRGGEPRGVFPEPTLENDGSEVRVRARVRGVAPPLEVSLRHHVRRGQAPAATAESALVPTGADGTLGTTLRPPLAATSIETEFVVQTPDHVPVLTVRGPTLQRAPPPSASPSPRNALASAIARRAQVRGEHRDARDEHGDEDDRDGSTGVLVAGVVAGVGVVTAIVVTLLVASGDMQPLFRIQL